MKAYGQFAWKLRHYRRGPPESNHSSNGRPVCRHLGERERPVSLYPLISLLPRSFSFPLAVRLSSVHSRLSPRSIPIAGSARRDVPFLLFLSLSFIADVEFTPRYHRRIIAAFIGTGRTDRAQDLAAARLIDINDRTAVSLIGGIKRRGRIVRIFPADKTCAGKRAEKTSVKLTSSPLTKTIMRHN